MILLAVGFLLLAAQTFGSDQAIITVSRDALSPDVIEVHVGELIRWQAPSGEHLHLRLDPPETESGRSGDQRARVDEVGTGETSSRADWDWYVDRSLPRHH